MSHPKVALYVRVSTDEQNPDAQLRDLREYCKNRGWNSVKEFVDVGESGSKDSRPQWNACWDGVQKARFHILLTHALDRLGRSLPHLVKILATVVEKNVTLISFRENIDLSTAAGRLLANLISVLADYELSIIRERTKAGLRAAKARGKQVGNVMRHFDRDRATELRDRGLGQIKIAKELGIGVGRVNAWVKKEYIPPSQRINGTDHTRLDEE